MSAQPEQKRFKGIAPTAEWLDSGDPARPLYFTGLLGHDPSEKRRCGDHRRGTRSGPQRPLAEPEPGGRSLPRRAPALGWRERLATCLPGFCRYMKGRDWPAARTLPAPSTFIYLAARELHGREQAPAAPLLLAGSIGFLFHAHEAQPMLATLTAHTAAYWGLAQLNGRALRGACCVGRRSRPRFPRQRAGSNAAVVLRGRLCRLARRKPPACDRDAAWLAAPGGSACWRLASCLAK